jgi:hypothetical protein
MRNMNIETEKRTDAPSPNPDVSPDADPVAAREPVPLPALEVP